MAEALCYVCNHCAHAIEAWSDGNPYLVNKDGFKEYVYHPDERILLCAGNDTPHLCLDCGNKFIVDSQDPLKVCVDCGSTQFERLFRLTNHVCPYCKKGKFIIDPKFYAIS